MASSRKSKTAAAPKGKLTKGCRKVLSVLEETNALSSAQDIYGHLRGSQSKAPGLTTVYRSLESLVGQGLVQSVDLGDGERRYEAVEPGEHHHHLVCLHCHQHIHLDSCLVHDIEDAVRENYLFEIESHVLEIFGTCAQCLPKKGNR
jgi:Fur family transcriptional regulator, ferric uptake regulator